MKSFKNLQTRLFITYSIVLILFALLISTPMYVYLKNNIETNIKESVEKIVSGYSDTIDASSAISNNVSTQLYINRDNSSYTAIQYLESIAYSKNTSSIDILQSEKAIQNFLYLNAAVYKPIHRINIFTTKGDFFSNQKADADITQTIHSSDWLKAVEEARGSIKMGYTKKDRWLSNDSNPIFSFLRQINWNSHPVGFLEIQFKASDLLNLDELETKQKAEIMILQAGEVLYSSSPEALTPSSQRLSAIFNKTGKSNVGSGFITNDQGKEDFFMYRTSQETGVTIFLTIPESQLFAPLRLVRNVIMFSVIILIAISVFVYFILARILTHPLKKLKKAIDSINLDEKNEAFIENKFHMGEIEIINRSFLELNQRLQDSLEETVQFRTLQMQAKFDVLQAHINPHFLFNMLGVITVLSDRGQMKAVSETSRKLSQFLRYSISSGSSMTTLREEVEFAKHYLDLLKSRYQHRLYYEIEVSEWLLDIQIPKLFIQPLIENAIQHGFPDIDKQLGIQIIGSITGNQWEICIRDNGVGFKPESLAALNTNIQNYLERMQNNEPSEEPLALGGVGLMNTIARLQLVFKEQYHFSFGNNEDSGAYVCFKGYLKR
ncbi:histidine kinase [Paenibacillus baekrokdamisoli]|uniref:Histidine kinase n=1 Tax=Paenibacillus baekrokdamisoli TaxID=1712516 RepID=A0A3G9JGK8_9BACL|nr:sensor histidine kinase [Paenibacillus baekrokdamisoli]MBB3070942.1 two-component system sensor histidine kinase YesM [Paenibacillus baekrokdamisoli]BBH22119.1 histidine kinase [Paenibacillus baekrokdamisoli]